MAIVLTSREEVCWSCWRDENMVMLELELRGSSLLSFHPTSGGKQITKLSTHTPADQTIHRSPLHTHKQGPDFDDISSFFPCEIDDAIQYINLEYGAQVPKIVIL